MAQVSIKVFNKTTGVVSLDETVELTSEEALELAQKFQALIQDLPAGTLEVVQTATQDPDHFTYKLEISGNMAQGPILNHPSFEEIYRRSSQG